MLYLWIKIFHVASTVCWFASLFYLPRLFVYHSQCDDKIGYDRFIVMENRLYYAIALPSMIATIVFGATLITLNSSIIQQGWLHAKITLVFFLIGYHHICGSHIKKFKAKSNKHSNTFYRFFNEVPMVFLLVILILIYIRPF